MREGGKGRENERLFVAVNLEGKKGWAKKKKIMWHEREKKMAKNKQNRPLCEKN